MVDVSNKQKSAVVTVTSSNGNTIVTANADSAQYWSKQAQAFANQSDESSKEAKLWANKLGDTVDGIEYSAKHYAELANSYVEGFEDVVTENTNSIIAIGNETLTEIENSRGEALNDINTVKDESIATVENKANEALTLVNNGITQINTTKNTAVDSINATKTNILKDIEFVAEGEKEEIQELADKAKDDIESTGFYMREDKLYFINSAGQEEEFKSGGGGLEIGDIGFTQMAIDESKGLRRILNGQVIIQDQYVQFTNIIKESVAINPSLACTEAEWQTAITMSTNGVCDKFVIDDNAGTIRLPKYPNYFIAGLTGNAPVVGNGMSLGLTNGTTTYSLIQSNGGGYEGFHKGTYSTATLPNTSSLVAPTSGTYPLYGVTTDPTKSGIEAQIKQEQIKGTYFIQVATGAETEDNIINEIELNNPFSFGDSKYSPVALNNLSWLKSEGQWNSKAFYPSYYDWALINANNGVEGFKFITDEYTDYDIVINPADETFRLPLLNGSESLPSDRYDELTILSSGSKYIAPANGYFCARGSTAGSFVSIYNPNTWIANCGDFLQNIDTGHATCPVKRGDEVQFAYNSTPLNFRFVYAQGNGSLYFYVGETVQNANLINAGRIEEKLSDKLDRNTIKSYITETYINGTSWYRVYSDGWCEQGGIFTGSSASNAVATINLLKAYKNTNYCITATKLTDDSSNSYCYGIRVVKAQKKVNSFQARPDSTGGMMWCTCGYIA